MSKRALDSQVGGNHYKNYKIQPMEFFMANNLSYPVAAIIKYVMRYRDKNGKEDLLKAMHIIEMLIEELEKESPETPIFLDRTRLEAIQPPKPGSCQRY